MRIAFAGTPEFAKVQLEALLTLPHELVVVYTQPDKPAGRGQVLQESPVKRLAIEHQLPVEQPLSVKSPEALSRLAQYHIDIMIVAAYGLILPESILHLPQYGCVNVHASLLPRWRGASPIQQAILAGDKETGITLMQMDAGLDTGAILVQAACPITPSETTGSLHDKLAALGATLLKAHVDQLPSLKKHAQTDAFVTHAGKIHKQDALIQWHLDAIQLDRQIRAFTPWPIAFTHINTHLLRIWQAHSVTLSSNHVPGTIVAHTSQGIVVSTGKDGLEITQAQLPGKKVLPFSEILKGHSDLFAIGQKLS